MQKKLNPKKQSVRTITFFFKTEIHQIIICPIEQFFFFFKSQAEISKYERIRAPRDEIVVALEAFQYRYVF